MTESSGVVWPLLVYFGLILVVIGGMLGVPYLAGQRHNDRATGEPYESGVMPTGSARLRFSVNYYLVAILFVIFDLEAVFIFAWAVAFRELGWPGYAAILVFVAVLVVALVYEWRSGALDWGPTPATRRRLQPKEQGEQHDAMVVE